MVDRNGKKIKESDMLQFVKNTFLQVTVASITEDRNGYITVQHLCDDRIATITEEALGRDWEVMEL